MMSATLTSDHGPLKVGTTVFVIGRDNDTGDIVVRAPATTGGVVASLRHGHGAYFIPASKLSAPSV